MSNIPPQPPAFIAGFGPKPADMSTLITTPLAFCAQRTVLRVGQPSGGQSLTASTYTTIQFPTPLEDPYSGWSTTATSSQIAYSYQPPYDGLYEITICAAVNAITGHVEPVIQVSSNLLYELGAASLNGTTAGIVTSSVRVAMLGGLDYVTGRIWTSATATTASAGLSRGCSMEIVYAGQ